jgi:hypothetical protein
MVGIATSKLRPVWNYLLEFAEYRHDLARKICRDLEIPFVR